MSIRRCFIGLAIASIFVMSIWPLGSVPQATAETLNYRIFVHATKAESFPIADVEGHLIGVVVREGIIIFENGELGWVKRIQINDLIKGAGTFNMYSTFTFQDGSTFITRSKGTTEATPQGVPSGGKGGGDIIRGTGRFQGVKGTMTTSVKLLPPEKGELVGKVIGEGTFIYTLPSK